MIDSFIAIYSQVAQCKESACNAGDVGSIPGLGRSPGEGNGSPLEHCCLESPMDGGAWGAAYGPGLAASDATEQRQLCPRGWTLQLFHIFTQTSFSQPGLFCPSCLKYSSAHVAFSVLFPDLGFFKCFTHCLLCNLCMGKDLYLLCSLLYSPDLRQ